MGEGRVHARVFPKKKEYTKVIAPTEEEKKKKKKMEKRKEIYKL
jgi:hypothetical protein